MKKVLKVYCVTAMAVNAIWAVLFATSERFRDWYWTNCFKAAVMMYKRAEKVREQLSVD